MDPITIATLINTLAPVLVSIIGALKHAGATPEQITQMLDRALAIHLSEIEILKARGR